MQDYTFEKKVDMLKRCGNLLMDKTFPNCKPGEDVDLMLLKTSDMIVDGYSCSVFYSKASYENYFIEVLQIWPTYHFFLYFNVVCKIAKKFLGKKGIYFFNIWNKDKMLYCWSIVKNKNGKIIDNFYSVKEEVIFDDLSYNLIEPEINNLNQF